MFTMYLTKNVSRAGRAKESHVKQHERRRIQGMIRFAYRMVMGTIRAGSDVLPEALGPTTVMLGTIGKSYACAYSRQPWAEIGVSTSPVAGGRPRI